MWQEYIRRQLEEEQRHLEVLQQQLLQEQAMLLVTPASTLSSSVRARMRPPFPELGMAAAITRPFGQCPGPTGSSGDILYGLTIEGHISRWHLLFIYLSIYLSH